MNEKISLYLWRILRKRLNGGLRKYRWGHGIWPKKVYLGRWEYSIMEKRIEVIDSYFGTTRSVLIPHIVYMGLYRVYLTHRASGISFTKDTQ